jgi:hypothetical protein
MGMLFFFGFVMLAVAVIAWIPGMLMDVQLRCRYQDSDAPAILRVDFHMTIEGFAAKKRVESDPSIVCVDVIQWWFARCHSDHCGDSYDIARQGSCRAPQRGLFLILDRSWRMSS